MFENDPRNVFENDPPALKVKTRAIYQSCTVNDNYQPAVHRPENCSGSLTMVTPVSLLSVMQNIIVHHAKVGE